MFWRLCACCSGVGLPQDPAALHEDMHAYLAACGVKVGGACGLGRVELKWLGWHGSDLMISPLHGPPHLSC